MFYIFASSTNPNGERKRKDGARLLERFFDLLRQKER